MGVLEGAKSVLRPGGRFVGEMGGFLNCVGIRGVLHRVLMQRGHNPVALDPWYFPSVDDYQQLLVSAGFTVTHISLSVRHTHLEQGLRGWLEVFVRNSFLKAFSAEEANAIMNEVSDACAVDCKDGAGNWAMIYMRLRFSAIMT